MIRVSENAKEMKTLEKITRVLYNILDVILTLSLPAANMCAFATSAEHVQTVHSEVLSCYAPFKPF